MGNQKEERRTDALDPWRTRQCKPVDMSDHGPRATQEDTARPARLRDMTKDEASEHRQRLIDQGVIVPASGE